MDLSKMGRFISRQRKLKGFTQSQLGDEVGVGCKAVSKWERGKNAPDISTLLKLSKVLDVTVTEILLGETIEEAIPDETARDIVISTANIYHKVFKKKYTKVLAAIIVVLFLITIAFSTIYFVTNYNKSTVYELTSIDKDYKLKGFIATDQTEDMIVLTDFEYFNSENIDDILISRVVLKLEIGNEFIQLKRLDLNKEEFRNIFKYLSTFSDYNEVNLTKYIKNLHDSDHINILIECTEINGNFMEILIPVKLTKRFSNNKFIK